MRFMMIVKASKDYEAGKMPSEELLAAMGKYNEELMKAGLLLDASGLKPTSAGARVQFSQGKVAGVIDGPFAETKEVIGGYWLIQADSLQQAIEWAMRSPAPHGQDQDAEIEIRPLFEFEDFAPGPAIDRHRELGQELAKKKGA